MGAWTDRISRFLFGVPTERQTDWRALAGEHCERANDLGASYSGAVAIIDGRDAMIRRLAGELRDLEMLWRAAGKRVAILQADVAGFRELEKGWIKANDRWKDDAAAAEAELAELNRQHGQRIEKLEAAVASEQAIGRVAARQRAELEAELAIAREERDLYKRAADDLLDVAHQYYGKAMEIAYGLHRPETTDGPDAGEEVIDGTEPHPYRPFASRDGSTRCGDCHAPPGHPVHRAPFSLSTPDEPSTLMSYEDFAAAVTKAELVPCDRGTSWSILGGYRIIRVRSLASGIEVTTVGTTHYRPCPTIADAIALAKELPF